MAWQNLHDDLDELFGQVTNHAEQMSAALERKFATGAAYMRAYWAANPVAYHAHLQRERARKRAYAADPEWVTRDRASARERMRRLRALRG